MGRASALEPSAQCRENPEKPNRCRVCSDITADRGSPIAEVSVEDIKALADHVDAALLPSTASRKLPE